MSFKEIHEQSKNLMSDGLTKIKNNILSGLNQSQPKSQNNQECQDAMNQLRKGLDEAKDFCGNSAESQKVHENANNALSNLAQNNTPENMTNVSNSIMDMQRQVGIQQMQNAIQQTQNGIQQAHNDLNNQASLQAGQNAIKGLQQIQQGLNAGSMTQAQQGINQVQQATQQMQSANTNNSPMANQGIQNMQQGLEQMQSAMNNLSNKDLNEEDCDINDNGDASVSKMQSAGSDLMNGMMKNQNQQNKGSQGQNGQNGSQNQSGQNQSGQDGSQGSSGSSSSQGSSQGQNGSQGQGQGQSDMGSSGSQGTPSNQGASQQGQGNSQEQSGLQSGNSTSGASGGQQGSNIASQTNSIRNTNTKLNSGMNSLGDTLGQTGGGNSGQGSGQGQGQGTGQGSGSGSGGGSGSGSGSGSSDPNREANGTPKNPFADAQQKGQGGGQGQSSGGGKGSVSVKGQGQNQGQGGDKGLDKTPGTVGEGQAQQGQGGNGINGGFSRDSYSTEKKSGFADTTRLNKQAEKQDLIGKPKYGDNDFASGKANVDQSLTKNMTVTYNGKKLSGTVNMDILSNHDKLHQQAGGSATEKRIEESKMALQNIKTKLELEKQKNADLDKDQAGKHSDRFIEFGLETNMSWKKLLRRCLQKERRGSSYSYLQPNRRYSNMGMTVVSRVKDKKVDVIKNVKVCVDTSGSVSPEELNLYLSQIARLTKEFDNVEGELLYWSNAVTDVGQFKNIEDLKRIHVGSTGGTDVRCVFEYLNGETKVDGKYEKHKPKEMAAVIIITDGCFYNNYEDYTKIFGSPSYKVIWMIEGNAMEFKPPFGNVVQITRQGD